MALEPQTYKICPSNYNVPIPEYTTRVSIITDLFDFSNLPDSVTHIILTADGTIQFNKTLVGVRFPPRLKHLNIALTNYDKSLKDVKFPETLQILEFSYLNEPLKNITLPESLEELRIESSYSYDLHGTHFPARITTLRICGALGPKKTLVGVEFPFGLEELELSGSFNLDISDYDFVNFCPHLERLTLGGYFNRRIDKLKLPNKIRAITFGNQFNQPISGIKWHELSNLQELVFHGYNRPLKGVVFPSTLHTLEFRGNFNQSLKDFEFPGSLKSFTLGYGFDQDISGVVFPHELEYIDLGDHFNKPVTDVVFPLCLRELWLSGMFEQPINEIDWYNMCPVLEELYVSGNTSLDGIRFPEQLKELQLHRFDKPIDAVYLPENLEVIDFGIDFKQNLSHVSFPPSVKKIKLSEKYLTDLFPEIRYQVNDYVEVVTL